MLSLLCYCCVLHVLTYPLLLLLLLLLGEEVD